MYGMDRDRRRESDRLHSPYRSRGEIDPRWDSDRENRYAWRTGPVGGSDDGMYPDYGGYKPRRDGYRSSSRVSHMSYHDGGSRRRDTSRMSYRQPERDQYGQGSYDISYRSQRDFDRQPSYERSRPRDDKWESRRTSREDLFDDDSDRRGQFSGRSDRDNDDRDFGKHERGRSRGGFEDSEWDQTDDERGKGKGEKDKKEKGDKKDKGSHADYGDKKDKGSHADYGDKKDKNDKGGYGDKKDKNDKGGYGDYGDKKEKGGYGDYGDKKDKGGYGDYGDKKDKGGYGDYGDKKDKGGYGDYGDKKDKGGYGDKEEKGDKDKKKSKADFDQFDDDENYIQISRPKGKGRGIHLQANDDGIEIAFRGKKNDKNEKSEKSEKNEKNEKNDKNDKNDDNSKSTSKPPKKDSGYKDADNESLGPDDSVSCIPNFGDYRKNKDGSRSWDHLRPFGNDRIEMSGGRGNGSFKSRQISPGAIEMQRVSQRRSPKDARRNQWTEMDKNLVVKDAIEAMNYEYEERGDTFYIFSYLDSNDISALIELSAEIQDERSRRVRQIEREKRKERARIDRVVMERSQSYSPPYHYSSYDRGPYRAPRMGMPHEYTSRKYRGPMDEGWMYEGDRW